LISHAILSVACGVDLTRPSILEDIMDKDRVEGSAKQAKGAVKDAAGKVLGDKKLQTEGKADKAAGKVQNAFGGAKDKLRETFGKKDEE
jgi:uncharacterized protein YjbJ (UPF0337 family)